MVQLGFWLGGSAGDALAQSAPVITNNPSVIVDLSVLEALGGGPVTLGAAVLAADPGQRGPIATVPLAPAASASVGNRGSAPAPLRAPPAAPRSRLNAGALAALGITAEVTPPPPAAAVQARAQQPVAETAARPPVAETASRQAAAAAPQRRPAPEVAPVPRAATAPPPPPAPVAAAAAAPGRPAVATRAETTVPPPPALPEARVAAAAPAASPPPAQVTAPPSAAAAPTPAPAAETQTASVAPTTAAEAPAAGLLSIAFNEGSAVLPDGARGELDDLVTALTGDPALKVQLRAFAAGTADTTSQARRLSLSRALAVRSFLIENGVQTTRMDVRALGNKSGDGPADRVDVVMVDQ